MASLEEPVKLLPYQQELYRVVRNLLVEQPHLNQDQVQIFTQKLDTYLIQNGWIDPEPPLESFDADTVTM
jgi:hypothetical protein